MDDEKFKAEKELFLKAKSCETKIAVKDVVDMLQTFFYHPDVSLIKNGGYTEEEQLVLRKFAVQLMLSFSTTLLASTGNIGTPEINELSKYGCKLDTVEVDNDEPDKYMN